MGSSRKHSRHRRRHHRDRRASSSEDSTKSGSSSDKDRSWRKERGNAYLRDESDTKRQASEEDHRTDRERREGCSSGRRRRRRSSSSPRARNDRVATSPKRDHDAERSHQSRHVTRDARNDPGCSQASGSHIRSPVRRRSHERQPRADPVHGRSSSSSREIAPGRRRSVSAGRRRSRDRHRSPRGRSDSPDHRRRGSKERSSTDQRRHRSESKERSSTDQRRRRSESKERSSTDQRRHRSGSKEHSRRRDKSRSKERRRSRSSSNEGVAPRHGKAAKDKTSDVPESSSSKHTKPSKSVSEPSQSSCSSEQGDSEPDVEQKRDLPMSKGEREKYEEFLKQEEARRKEEKKRLKELMKERETPEQKRARRLAKKEAKERKRKQEMGWDEEYAGYTNLDNPFGDSNLLQTFKWSKKLEKEGLKNIKDEELERMNRRKREEQRQELEKVKERRLERERERAERDAAIELEQRLREGAQFEQWAAQEDSFHLQQAKLRSKIRIEDGRAKPIDLLARYISAEEEDFSVDMIEPYLYLNGLTLDDFEDLIEDINVYMRLESKKNQEYWNDIRIIVDEEVRKLHNEEKTAEDNNERGGRKAISTEVSGDIVNVFKGKTPKQLGVLKGQIEQKLSERAPGLDVAYWETLLSRLRSYMARARLRERHEENLRKKLEQLKMEQGVEEEAERVSASKEAAGECSAGSPARDQDETSQGSERDELDPLQQSIDDYNSGRYTPVLVRVQDLEPGTLLTGPDEDEQRREARKQMLRTGGTAKLTRAEENFEREARKGMDTEEARFSVEENLVDSQSYQWSDKWRPRKPRYFNRVHTGFEWNKYNQTHYDIDNPPPKIVQGYKFNIFYPDLIDKNKTPQYFLIPCKENPDFSILRFHAGPPYEDIAFKVVNREWEYSYKKGFRCQFHNDIFQLWFHFKRYRYRR